MRPPEDVNMFKRTLLLAALPAVMLGGCSGTKNRGLESVHQPVVSRTDYSFDVGTVPNGLAPGEEQRLAGGMASHSLVRPMRLLRMNCPSRSSAEGLMSQTFMPRSS